MRKRWTSQGNAIIIAILLLLMAVFSGCIELPEQGHLPQPTIYHDLDSALDTGKPVVVYFNEAWCSGCKDQQPIIQGISLAVGDNAAVVVLDKAANEDVAARYGIDIAPNMVILDSDGMVVKTGYTSGDELRALIEGL